MEYRLKDCLEKVIDNRGKNPKYFDKEKYPVIDNVFIKNNYYINDKIVNRYINQETYDNFLRGYVEENMPIMTLVGSGIGNVGLIKKENVAIVQNTIGFKTKENLDSKYLYYWFLTKQNELQSFNRGSGQPSIKKTDVENMEIDLPDIAIQKKIVNILEKLDDKIYLNNQINDNLHELCNNLYTDLINRLDDTNSSVEIIKNVAKCVLGGTPSRAKEEYWNGAINWINSGEINKFRIIEASEKITDLGLNKSSTTLLPKGTTVLAITGATLGQVSRLEIDSCANQSVIGIMTNEKKLNNYMYLSILNSINDLILKQTGGAQQHINKNDVETHEILVPNKELISKFDETVKPLFEQISINCFENQRLEKLRDTLLPKLMNGEIDLDKIEI